jgi:rhodanese-related sulfurtransferase
MRNLFLYLTLAGAVFAQSACSQNAAEQKTETTSAVGEDVIFVDLTIDEFFAKWSEKQGQLVDVRTPEEYAGGHAKGASNMNFLDESFITTASANLDKNAPLFIYCASGNRSGKAKAQLKEAGFKEVYNLTGGGYKQWEAKGFPVEQ